MLGVTRKGRTEGCDWGPRPRRLEEDDEEAKAEGGNGKRRI